MNPTEQQVAEILTARPRHIEPQPVDDETRNPTCGRCAERRDRYDHVAAGNGTIAEIREAIAALDYVRRQGLPLGAKIKIDGAWVCPRCTADPGSDDDTPLLEVLPNRAARRRNKLRRNRRG